MAEELVRDIPEEERRYTLEDLTLSPAERERVELRGLLMAAIHDGLDGAITGQVSDRGVERCADHILREWVPRFLAVRSVDATAWHEAALSAWHAWERLSFASTPLDYADAVVAMSNAMSDLGTFLPGYDYRTGTIPRSDEEADHG